MTMGIQNLANMEYQLYGYGTGLRANCPSYFNGYMSQSPLNNAYANYYNPAFKGGYSGQDIFTQQNDATRVSNPVTEGAQNNPQLDWSNPQFRGLSDDLNTLGDYYVKNSAPSESFAGAAIGGATLGLITNLRLIAHPWNSFRHALKPTAEMFKDVGKEGTELRKLWLNPETNGVVREAYGQMHKLHGAMHSRLGLFKAKLQGESLTEANNIIRGMKQAFKTGNIQEIAEFSEEARRLTNAKTGYIPSAFKWVKGKLKGTSAAGATETSAEEITRQIQNAAKKNIEDKAASSTLSGAIKHSWNLKTGGLFAAFEFLSDLMDGKIQAAFDKDNSTGCKQLGQTAVKGAGSAIGWMVGEGVGKFAGGMAAKGLSSLVGRWAGTKIGATVGTMVCPGVGTAIGAVAGLVGGMIGSWAIGKFITHPLIGEEAGTKAKAEKMKQTAQGQVELLKLTATQAQGDKKIDPRTMQAINNIAQFYGARQ